MRKVSQLNWEPYDPGLAALARAQDPPDVGLAEALELCTIARPRACCALRVCGYDFVESRRPNEPGSRWQFDHGTILLNESRLHGVGDVVVDVLIGGRVGGIEFL